MTFSIRQKLVRVYKLGLYKFSFIDRPLPLYSNCKLSIFPQKPTNKSPHNPASNSIMKAASFKYFLCL